MILDKILFSLHFDCHLSEEVLHYFGSVNYVIRYKNEQETETTEDILLNKIDWVGLWIPLGLKLNFWIALLYFYKSNIIGLFSHCKSRLSQD